MTHSIHELSHRNCRRRSSRACWKSASNNAILPAFPRISAPLRRSRAPGFPTGFALPPPAVAVSFPIPRRRPRAPRPRRVSDSPSPRGPSPAATPGSPISSGDRTCHPRDRHRTPARRDPAAPGCAARASAPRPVRRRFSPAYWRALPPVPATSRSFPGPCRAGPAQGRRSRSGTGRARRSRRRRRRDTRSSPLPSLRPRRRSSTRTRRSRFGPGRTGRRRSRRGRSAPGPGRPEAARRQMLRQGNISASGEGRTWDLRSRSVTGEHGISVIHNLIAWQCEVPRLPGTVGTASAAPLPGRFGAAERGRVCSARERLAGDSRENGSRQRRGRPDGGTLCAWCADSYTSRGKIPTVMDGAELSC